MKRLPFPLIIVLAALISAAVIGGAFFYYYPSRESLQALNSNDFVISAASDPALRVVGVMIDNHPDARPESGVARAKIVYEAPVEGGLTRYLAIFDSQQTAAEVGPVRSARPYFLDWLQEYGDGLYMHSGGSPEALNLIKARNIFDANEFFWGEYYWRSQGRPAPHNLYTNSDNWTKIVDRYGSTSSMFTADRAWKYSRLVGQTIGKKGELKIPYGPANMVSWIYDAETLDYARFINGQPEIDKDGTAVRARNILVQITGVKEIAGDDKGRVEIAAVGGGEAIILKKGSVTYGTWKKSSPSARTRFYDRNKNEVVLAPGNTWVEVTPKETNILVTD